MMDLHQNFFGESKFLGEPK